MIEENAILGGNGAHQATKKLKITIPAGVRNGTRWRRDAVNEMASWDLYVYLFLNEDAEFQRDGINILGIKISYLQAILVLLGGEYSRPAGGTYSSRNAAIPL